MIIVCLYLSTHYSAPDTRHVAIPKNEHRGVNLIGAEKGGWIRLTGAVPPWPEVSPKSRESINQTSDAGQGQCHPAGTKGRGTSRPQGGGVLQDGGEQVSLRREVGRIIQMILQAVSSQPLERGPAETRQKDLGLGSNLGRDTEN